MFLRRLGLAAALAACLPLFACAPRRDAACFGGAPAPSGPMLRVDASELGRGQAGSGADPQLEPSASERRKAKAEAEALAEILARGGNVMYRHDGSSSDPASVRYVAAPGALTLKLEVSPDLNTFDGTPHALQFIVYHLSDRFAFDQLAESPDGLARLMEGRRFDASVRAVREMAVQPGRVAETKVDRAEGGRYVALVAGYGMEGSAPPVFVAEYDLGRYRQKQEEEAKFLSLKTSRNVDMFKPLPMCVRVRLGADAMTAWKADYIDATPLRAKKSYIPPPIPGPGDI